MDPLTVVAVVGLNCTLSVALCDGASVNGVATPLAAKAWPLTLTCEIVALLLPVFVIVRFWFAELPAFTFPKLKEAGETDNVDVAAVPVPVTAMPAGEFGAFDTTLIVPLVLPEVCGANCTLNVLLWLGAIVIGAVSPVMVTPAPVALSCVIFRLAVPVLVITTGCDFDCPFIKLPKLMLAGETLIPACTPVPERLRPGAAPGASLLMPTVPPTNPVAVGA